MPGSRDVTRARIVITEFIAERSVHALEHEFDTHYDPHLADRHHELLEAVRNVDALIVRNRTRVDAALLANATSLRVIGRLGAGLDNIDLEACRARAIEVIPASGANARAVAEYVLCTAMMLLRGAYQSTSRVAKGEWPRVALSHGREIYGKTLGVVGFGATGRASARLARALGMHVIAYDPVLDPANSVWSEPSSRRCRSICSSVSPMSSRCMCRSRRTR